MESVEGKVFFVVVRGKNEENARTRGGKRKSKVKYCISVMNKIYRIAVENVIYIIYNERVKFLIKFILLATKTLRFLF